MSAGDVVEVRTLDEAAALVRLVGIEPGEVLAVLPWAHSVVVVSTLPDHLGDALDDALDAIADAVPVDRGTWWAFMVTPAGDLRHVEREGGRLCL